MVTYLIHFDKKYKHAQHYIGTTKNLENRIKRHASGTGSSLLRYLNSIGIKWKVVKIWNDKGFDFEKKLKKQKNAKGICPICNPKYNGEYK